MTAVDRFLRRCRDKRETLMTVRYVPVVAAGSLALIAALAVAQQSQPAPEATPPASAPAHPSLPQQAPPAPAQVPFVPASTPEQEQLRVVPAKHYAGKVHLLPATMETTQWGRFNNAQPPVLHVNS